MKKYWVITRQSHNEGGGFNAYPADEDNLKRITEIAMDGRESENYWVAEQIEFHKPVPIMFE